ncbi:MAG: YicC family protein [Saprospiraceae bacterium]|nr:YicC family protein [Saprospiraceae bacterium]
MTGYGRATGNFGEKTITVEIRSLNSKFMDLRLKIPQTYKDRETDIRKIVTDKLERGKLDMLIETSAAQGEEEFALNRPLFKMYFKELNALADELGMDKEGILPSIMRLPNIVAPSTGSLDPDEWETLKSILVEAAEKVNVFRADEGKAMAADLTKRVESIVSKLSDVPPFEEDRMVKLRQRLWQNLEEYVGKDNIDENRFEQELMFYLEKMDITEEKVRLEQHCQYFLSELKTPKVSQKGRKLSFISQEMGREINTLGAKAYSSDIQKIVVEMKDELEKIKEQIANIV